METGDNFPSMDLYIKVKTIKLQLNNIQQQLIHYAVKEENK